MGAFVLLLFNVMLSGWNLRDITFLGSLAATAGVVLENCLLAYVRPAPPDNRSHALRS